MRFRLMRIRADGLFNPTPFDNLEEAHAAWYSECNDPLTVFACIYDSVNRGMVIMFSQQPPAGYDARPQQIEGEVNEALTPSEGKLN